MTVNERLKQARKYLGLSQEFVARETNCSLAEIQEIEYGKREVSDSDLEKFSKFFGLSIQELKYGREETEMDKKLKEMKDLSDTDKRAISDLYQFKEEYKKRNNKEPAL